ncbi:MAG TPA: bifunctional DNA primase/polymerase, partial [Candidatus Nitrosocosmicus sp.]
MTFASTDILSSIHLKGYFRQRQPLHDVNILNLLKRDPQASINVWADYWYNKIGVNVIPADTKNKMPTEKWTEWQDKPISEEVHQEWKDKNRYSNGIALIPGKVWRGPNSGKFLVFIDLDNQKAIDEVCTSFNCSNLEYLANYVIVEQHQDNKSKAHLYFYSDHIFTKKSSDVVKMKDGILNNEIPAIEVKGSGEHGIACCSPSIHKDGNKYEIIGTMEPKTYGKEIEISLFEIYKKYNLGTNNQGKIPIERLFDTDFIVSEGHNRHEALLRVMESLIQRNKIMLSLEQIRNMAIEWNNIHCNPPLDDKEFEKQWIDASDYIHKQESNSSVTPSSKINRYITKKINDNPEVYYYADRIEKKIGSYKIVDKIDKTSGKDIKEKIFGNRIIGAIPKRIFIYNDNPLLQKSLEKTKIIFETPKDEEYEIGPYDSNELIIRELGNKYLVINKRRADEALSCIINAYRENGIVEYLDGLTTGGYYLINNNIKTVGSLQNISNDFDK